MTMSTDVPTRFAADLFESAQVEGARESRSAKQQLDHWARVGRSVSMHQTTARRRIEAVLAGEIDLDELSDEEQVVANAEIDTAIEERANSTSFGAQLRTAGIATVALDADGGLVEHRPDGTTVLLAPAAD
jgi:ParD-like antitoxin of type II bacterial toxin-antitoxin system